MDDVGALAVLGGVTCGLMWFGRFEREAVTWARPMGTGGVYSVGRRYSSGLGDSVIYDCTRGLFAEGVWW